MCCPPNLKCEISPYSFERLYKTVRGSRRKLKNRLRGSLEEGPGG